MDALLVTVTLASLLVAGGMSLVVWRVVRGERQRSAARIAALAADIDSPAPAEISVVTPSHDPEGSTTDAAARGLFAATVTDASPMARLGPAILAGALLVAGASGAIWWMSGGTSSASATAAADPRPLELLSMRHAIERGSLSVTGLVKNPTTNPVLGRLTAVVFVFDANGGFLSSGRAPLDFAALSPGEESPFVVTLDAPPGAARYRVSFRRDEGGVLAHVDRRGGR